MRLIALTASLVAICGVAFAQAPAPTPPPSARLADGEAASTLLPPLVEHSRHTATLENGRLGGEGGAFLRALGADAQFVMIGEEHGNAGIADFVAAYWRDLNEAGYQYAAVETDPWVAAAMERELRAGGLEQWSAFLAERGGATAAPFFSWTPEVRLAATVLETSQARRERAIWGLDQVFIGSTSWLLRDVAESAANPEARVVAARLAAEANGDLRLLGRSETQPLLDLRARLNGRRDRGHAAMIDAMLQSQRIYRPFTGGGGETYLANTEREALMRRLFLERYRAAERADGAPPRVMLKFGANHIYRGATPTHVQGLGGFVTELGAQTGGGALSILVGCGPGGAVASLQGPPVSCADYFNQNFAFLAPFTDAQHITVFDLRPWRMRPGRWAHLPAEIRQMIDSFDLLVVVPNGPASEFLPGLPPLQPPPS